MIKPVGMVDSMLASIRLLLAAVFFLAGSAKLFDPVGTRKAVRDFGVPAMLARPVVVLLPLVELLVAAAMIPVGLVWYGAWGVLLLLGVFLIAIAIAMIRGRTPDCHCFGQLHSAPIGWTTWVRNGLLAACAGWIVSRDKRQTGPDLWVWLSGLSSVESKVVIIAGCAVAFLFLLIVLRARPQSKAVAVMAETEEEEVEREPAELVAAAPKREAESVESSVVMEPAPVRPQVQNIGLPIGTPAPEFELATANGEMRSLQSLLQPGRDLLLVFLSPFCPPCQALASNLVRWIREMQGLPDIILVSRGTAKDNGEKLKTFQPARILLQRTTEVAALFDCDTTPAAVLVGADGSIQSLLANGGVAIKQLLVSCIKRASPEVKSTKASQRASALGN